MKVFLSSFSVASFTTVLKRRHTHAWTNKWRNSLYFDKFNWIIIVFHKHQVLWKLASENTCVRLPLNPDKETCHMIPEDLNRSKFSVRPPPSPLSVWLPPYLGEPALPRTSLSWSGFLGWKWDIFQIFAPHLDVKRLWYIGDSKVNEFADAEDKVLKDDDKEKPQGKYVPGQCIAMCSSNNIFIWPFFADFFTNQWTGVRFPSWSRNPLQQNT